MIDYEKAVLLLMVNNIESFETTCLRSEYFLNNNYSKLFKSMQEGLILLFLTTAIQNTTMNDISDFISSVGFPIVVCLLMIYQQQKMSDSYIQIVDSLKELISDNTKAINLLIERAKENDGKMIEMVRGAIKTDENEQETK